MSSFYSTLAGTDSTRTHLKNKRFTNLVVFPLEGRKDDAMFDSGTDTPSGNSVLTATQLHDDALMKTFWNLSKYATHYITYIKLPCSLKV